MHTTDSELTFSLLSNGQCVLQGVDHVYTYMCKQMKQPFDAHMHTVGIILVCANILT